MGWQGSPHLKILCGGEAFHRALANQLLVRGASLWNLYGPTESTNLVNCLQGLVH